MIQPTDPVSVLAAFKEKKHINQHLYAVIFGESILNDAVGLILFNTFSKMYFSLGEETTVKESVILFIPTFLLLLFGSMALGFVIGLLSSWVIQPPSF